MAGGKHTVGPWSVNVNGAEEWSVDYDGDSSSYVTISGKRQAPIAFAVEPSAYGGDVDANARLIAAAPDHALIGWAMCAQGARWEEWSEGKGEFCFAGFRHATTLDEFGLPVLTAHLRTVLQAAKAQGESQ